MNNLNKWKLTITSIIIILPALLGLLFNSSTLFTHYDGSDQTNYLNTLLLPLLLAAVHILCIIFTRKDNRSNNQNKKILNLLYWIIPSISTLLYVFFYFIKMNNTINIEFSIRLLLGLIFVIIGNYLPKCVPNHTIGIRIKYTLTSKTNWYLTHRFAAKVWVVTGIIILSTIFIPAYQIHTIIFILIIVAIVVPIIYSYQYYRKHPESIDNEILYQGNKKLNIILLIGLVIFLGVVMFGAKYSITCDQTNLNIEARFWNDSTILYEDIDNVTYRNSDNTGARTYGYGTPFISMGQYQNEEFGTYLRYTYPSCNDNIVIEINDKHIVINLKDSQATKALYDELVKKLCN